jgi:hypothetical protein
MLIWGAVTAVFFTFGSLFVGWVAAHKALADRSFELGYEIPWDSGNTAILLWGCWKGMYTGFIVGASGILIRAGWSAASSQLAKEINQLKR